MSAERDKKILFLLALKETKLAEILSKTEKVCCDPEDSKDIQKLQVLWRKRQSLLGDLQSVEKELSPMLHQWQLERSRGLRSPENEVEDRRARTHVVIRKILTWDAKIKQALSEDGQEVQAKLEALQQGRKALNTYRPAFSADPKFYDQRI